MQSESAFAFTPAAIEREGMAALVQRDPVQPCALPRAPRTLAHGRIAKRVAAAVPAKDELTLAEAHPVLQEQVAQLGLELTRAR